MLGVNQWTVALVLIFTTLIIAEYIAGGVCHRDSSLWVDIVRSALMDW